MIIAAINPDDTGVTTAAKIYIYTIDSSTNEQILYVSIYNFDLMNFYAWIEYN